MTTFATSIVPGIEFAVYAAKNEPAGDRRRKGEPVLTEYWY
jgi:hypothetical protein